MENNPWKIKSTKNVYENPWIKVEHHEVLTPNDTDGIYGTVHFKNIALGIIPLTNDYNTFLVGQYRFPLKEYSWEIPMGGGLQNVDKLVSAQRELLEEVGIIAKNWKEILKIHTSNSVCDEEGFVFIAKDLEFTDAQPEETEILQVKRLTFKTVFAMVMKGEITDSLSIAGILKTKILIDQGII
jgi:ADP-ribose pyrophosphatase